MSEVTVSKKESGSSLSRARGSVSPMSPFTRSFGLSPFGALNPFATMRRFADEVDRMLLGSGAETEIGWAPIVDVQHRNGNLVISAELPGLKKDELKVQVTDDQLVIEGERKREHEEVHGGYHRLERSYGRFFRAIPLPEGAKSDQVKAELKDGLLTVTIPAPEAVKKAREVPIAG
jgi:HSP20 family protein